MCRRRLVGCLLGLVWAGASAACGGPSPRRFSILLHSTEPGIGDFMRLRFELVGDGDPVPPVELPRDAPIDSRELSGGRLRSVTVTALSADGKVVGRGGVGEISGDADRTTEVHVTLGPPGAWGCLRPQPSGGPFERAIAVAAKGRVLIVSHGRAEVFDLVRRNELVPLRGADRALDGSAALALEDGRLVLIGGADANAVPRRELLTVRPGDDELVALEPSLSSARSRATAFSISATRVVVVGGVGMGAVTVTTAEVLDFSGAQERQTIGTPIAAIGASALVAPNGPALIVGGGNDGQTYWVRRDPVDARLGPSHAPGNRTDHAASMVTDTIGVLVGGTGTAAASAVLFDVVAPAKKRELTLEPPRAGAAAIRLAGTERALVAGGVVSGAPTNTTLWIDADGTTIAGPPLVKPRAYAAIVPTDIGGALAIGGHTAPSCAVEMYTPPAP